MKYLEKKVALSVRSILLKHLEGRYLEASENRFYHIPLEDAPARITSDLEAFSTEAVHMLVSCLPITMQREVK
jgi:hypothetical protein